MTYLQGVDEQLKIFLYSLGMGAILCMLYDIFKALRVMMNFGSKLIFLQDLIYSVFASILTFLYLLLMNNGRVRLYILLGEVLGFLTYYFTLSKLFNNSLYIFKRKITALQIKLFTPLRKINFKNLPLKHFNALKNRFGAKKGS